MYITRAFHKENSVKNENNIDLFYDFRRKLHEEVVVAIIIATVLLVAVLVLVGICWITLRNKPYFKGEKFFIVVFNSDMYLSGTNTLPLL